jgi:hypothetical protein
MNAMRNTKHTNTHTWGGREVVSRLESPHLSALEVAKLFRQRHGKVINRYGFDAIQLFHLSDGFDLPTADVVMDLLLWFYFFAYSFECERSKSFG